jgi:hypothetical protein
MTDFRHQFLLNPVAIELNLLSGPKIKSAKIKNKFSRFLDKSKI